MWSDLMGTFPTPSVTQCGASFAFLRGLKVAIKGSLDRGRALLSEFVRNGLIDLTACRGHCRSDEMDRPTEQGVVKYISWDIASTRHSVLTIGDNSQRHGQIPLLLGKDTFHIGHR